MTREQNIFETNNYDGGLLVDRNTNLPVGFTSRGVDQHFVTASTDPVTGAVNFSSETPTLKKISETPTAIFCQHTDGRYLCTDGQNATGGEQGHQLFVVTGDPFGTHTRSFLTKTLSSQLLSVAGETTTGGDIIDAWWLSTGEILFTSLLTIGGIVGRFNIYRAKESSPGSGVWTVGADAGCSDKKPVIELGMVSGTQTPYVRTLHARSLCEATIAGAKVVLVGEYNVASPRTDGGANDQVRYYKSTDGGRTFTVLLTFNQGGTNHVRHAHSVVQDPGSGNIFFLLGDVAKSAIIRWDGASSAPAANTAPSAFSLTTGWAFYGSDGNYTSGDILFDDVSGRFLTDIDTPSTYGNTAMHIDCASVRTFAGLEIERLTDRAPLIAARSRKTGAMFWFSLISLNDGLDCSFRVWASSDGKKWLSIGKIAQYNPAYEGVISNVFFDSSNRLIVTGIKSTKGTQLVAGSTAALQKGSSLAFVEDWVSQPSSTAVLS